VFSRNKSKPLCCPGIQFLTALDAGYWPQKSIFVTLKLKRRYMKKVLMLATAAFLISGVAFANGDKGKSKEKAKKTCTKGGKCCGKEDKTKKA
jgi:hypothetical protein